LAQAPRFKGPARHARHAEAAQAAARRGPMFTPCLGEPEPDDSAGFDEWLSPSGPACQLIPSRHCPGEGQPRRRACFDSFATEAQKVAAGVTSSDGEYQNAEYEGEPIEFRKSIQGGSLRCISDASTSCGTGSSPSGSSSDSAGDSPVGRLSASHAGSGPYGDRELGSRPLAGGGGRRREHGQGSRRTDLVAVARRLEELMRELFRHHDLNSNGLLEETELVSLNECIARLHHGEDFDTSQVRQTYKDLFRSRLSPDGGVVPFGTFQVYCKQVMEDLDPDPEAQELILEHFVAEAAAACALLPQLRTSRDREASEASEADPFIELGGPSIWTAVRPGDNCL